MHLFVTENDTDQRKALDLFYLNAFKRSDYDRTTVPNHMDRSDLPVCNILLESVGNLR
jgi:hypothetical protein